MRSLSPDRPEKRYLACLVTALLLLSLASGCTRQEDQSQAPVTATKSDDSHILVSFVGGPGMDTLSKMEITLTDSQGRSLTRPIGPRPNETTVQAPSSLTFTGQYAGTSHVSVTATFANGTRTVVLDKDL